MGLTPGTLTSGDLSKMIPNTSPDTHGDTPRMQLGGRSMSDG